MTKLLSKGNSKLSQKVGVWNILAGMEVCGQECKGCYAIKEQKRWKGSVVKGRTNRLEISKQDRFVLDMVTEILKSDFKYIRIHGSGEFYSQEYIDKWAKIAYGVFRVRPYVKFFTYTKREKDFDFKQLKIQGNFILHESYVEVDGKTVMNYGSQELMDDIQKKTDGFVCPLVTDRTGACGEECTWCMDKLNQGTPILFYAH